MQKDLYWFLIPAGQTQMANISRCGLSCWTNLCPAFNFKWISRGSIVACSSKGCKIDVYKSNQVQELQIQEHNLWSNNTVRRPGTTPPSPKGMFYVTCPCRSTVLVSRTRAHRAKPNCRVSGTWGNKLYKIFLVCSSVVHCLCTSHLV